MMIILVDQKFKMSSETYLIWVVLLLSAHSVFIEATNVILIHIEQFRLFAA